MGFDSQALDKQRRELTNQVKAMKQEVLGPAGRVTGFQKDGERDSVILTDLFSRCPTVGSFIVWAATSWSKII